MFKAVARLMIVLMLWNSIAFAQAAKESDEERREGASPAWTQVDPTVLQDREAYRLLRGLDRPVDPDSYVVGPSDQFVLMIRGPRETKINLRVLPEGTVLLPNVGALGVAGMTITEMRNLLRERLKPYYRNVEFDCQLLVPRTILAYVLGEVNRPGAVELYAPFRLDMALAGAGGITDRGTRRAIEIRRDGEVEMRADFLRFLRDGEIEHNPAIGEFQVVYVPPLGASCTVIGEVWRGGRLELLEGETIADMIDLAGGFTPNALTDRIVLERVDENRNLSVTELEWERAGSTALQDLDVVVIPDRNSFPGRDFVRVFGGGGRDGLIQISEGETLAEFIPRFTRLRETHDLSHAVIERKLPEGGVQHIPVDLKAVIEGTGDGSIVLEPDDVINIPPFEQFVYVVGAVVNPAPIEFQRGYPAERYVTMAGGPSNTGSIDRLEIIGLDGKKRSAGRTSTVYRGETILVKEKRSRLFQAVFLSLTSLASLALSIVAVSRN